MRSLEELQKRSFAKVPGREYIHAGATCDKRVWEDLLKWCRDNGVARSALVESLCLDFLEKQTVRYQRLLGVLPVNFNESKTG